MKRNFASLVFATLCAGILCTFSSCNDYDDEINNLQEQITNGSEKLANELKATKTALEEELQEVKGSYETQIAEATSALQTAISQKADESTVTLLTTRVVELEQDFAAKTAALETQIATISSDIQNINAALAQKVSISELTAYKAQAAADLAAVTGNVDKLAENLEKLAEESNLSIASILESLKDIQNKINSQVSQLSDEDKRIAAEVEQNYQTLLSEIAEAKKEATDEAAKIISNEETARIAAVNDLWVQIRALQAFQISIESLDIEENIEGIKSQIEGIKGDVDNRVNGIKEDIVKLTERISTNETDIATIQGELGRINDELGKLNDKITTLTVLIEKSLTSLVFKPTQYMYGFGVINVQSFVGCKTLQKKVVNAGSLGQVEEYEIAVTPVLSTWAPTAHAKYHMNPSTADYTKYNFSFADIETKNVLTRSNDNKSIGATAGNIKAENGILDVEVKIAYLENLNDAVAEFEKYDVYDADGVQIDHFYEATSAWVSTLALQATEKEKKGNEDKSITSDYALVVPSYYGNLVLANSEAADKHSAIDNTSGHLRTNAVQTINDELATFEIPYNGSLDLTQRIETHYAVSSAENGEKVGDKAFTPAEFAETGLTYDYSLVNYKTTLFPNQAVIAEISEDGIITVAGQNARYIGETFVARVLLRDGNKKNVAVGYAKILIVDQGAEPAEVTTGLVLNCSNPTSTNIGMTDFVKQFQENYSSALVVNDFKGSKYALDATVYSNKSTNPSPFGKGSFKLNGDKLTLEFTSAEAKELFYPEEVVTPKTVTVYAKFAHQNAGYSDLWVKITIDKDQIVYAKGTFANADKIKSYWYEKNSKIAADVSGKYDEIHANVSVPEYGGVNPTFNYKAFNAFVGSKAAITGIDERLTAYTADPYADFTIAMSNDGKKVKGASSTVDVPVEYVLVVKDKKTLTAFKVGDDTRTEQDIVVLSGDYYSTVNFQETDYAKDILNYKAHNELAEGETFAVGITLEQNRNCYNVELDGNNFQIKFLRPINITDIPARPTIDAEHGGGIWNVQDLVEFTDWREYKFDDYGNQYYNYYGVNHNSVKPRYMDGNKIKNARSDINGNADDILDQTAPDIHLTWDPNAGNSKIDGKIGYVNNGQTTNSDFHIWVPVQVDYAWGTIYTEVKLTIAKTIQQIRKK